jgi:hypothetical protein
MAQRMLNAVRGFNKPGPRMADVGNDLTELFAGGRGFQDVSATPATVSAGKGTVGISKTGTVTVTLPTGIVGQRVVLVDTAGDGTAQNKTIAAAAGQTVGGTSTKVIAVNNGVADLLFIGTNWIVLPSSKLTA